MGNSSQSIELAIRRHFNEHPLFDGLDTANLALEQDLIEDRILDSVGIFNLIVFLEHEFAIRVEIFELSATNFSTLARIIQLVENKWVEPNVEC